MDCNKELAEVSNLKLCNSVNYGFEPVSDKPSITIKGERLDFRNLLSRASAGILDLNMFSLPRTSDLSGSNVTEEKIDELMNRPRSVMDNLFGASVEEAEQEMLRHKSVISEEMNKLKPKDPSPDPSPDSAPVE